MGGWGFGSMIDWLVEGAVFWGVGGCGDSWGERTGVLAGWRRR